MIVAQRKPLAEVLQMTAGLRRVLVLGCGGCVTVCLTGGERAADVLASQLRLAARRAGDDVTIDVDCITRQCDREFLGDLKRDPTEYDAVLSLACGAGVGFLTEIYERPPILPAMNTTFLGANTAAGVWSEYCRGCGDCALAWTGGICPVTQCAKGLLNGPCGGADKGLCEVNPDMPCGWHAIYERLEALGRLDELRKRREPRDFRKDRAAGVRRLVLAEMTDDADDSEAGDEEASP